MSSRQTNRIDYIEAVRVFSLILGIVFHASLSFMPIFIGWAVMDLYTSSSVQYFALISHSFRMELFFLIAGFFACIKYHQLGFRGFLKSRLVRIGLPFIAGWFILRPLLVSGWTLGADSMRGDVDYYAALSSATNIITQLNDSLFVGTHLWFLYYLLMSTVSVIIVRYLLTLNKDVYSTIRRYIDAVISKLCHSSWGILVLAFPTALCLWFMKQWGVDTPDKSMVPQLSVLFLYSIFFSFGWLLNRQRSNHQAVSCLTWPRMVMTCVSIYTTIQLASYQMQYSHANYFVIKISFSYSYAVMMWSLVFLTLGIFNSLIKRSNKVISYLSEASYWLYLIHLPIVIYLQVAFAELPLPWLVKLVSICVITLILSLLMYTAFVRSTFVGDLLNGKRLARLR